VVTNFARLLLFVFSLPFVVLAELFSAGQERRGRREEQEMNSRVLGQKNSVQIVDVGANPVCR